MKSLIKALFLILLPLLLVAIAYAPQIRKHLSTNKGIVKIAKKRIFNYLNIPLIGTPDLKNLKKRLSQKGVKLGDPIFMRIFKKESELELWIKKDNRFIHFTTYPICTWSGYLGPKQKQGDYQSPEGFYTVTKSRLNPNSRYHRSFNLGYPNQFDKAHKRTGDFLMVHGNCVSAGCYAMTDPVITEIWEIVTAALNRKQKRFHVHAFPFRMTEINLVLNNDNQWLPFWENLKQGYDVFEKNHIPPSVKVCNKRYIIRPGKNNSIGSSTVSKDCKNLSTAEL